MLMTDEEERALEAARAAVLEHEKALGERAEQVQQQQAHLEYRPDRAFLARGLVDHYPFDALTAQASPNVAGGRSDAEVLGTLDVIDGPRGGALLFDDDYDYIHLKGAGLFDRTGPFSVGLWLRLDEGGAYARIVGNSDNKHTFWRGWELYVDSLDHVAARLIHALPHNYLHVRANEPLALSSWTHVAVTYDGSSRAEGLRLYVDGKEVAVSVEHDRLYKSFLPVGSDYEVTDRAPRVARSYRAFGGDDGIFTGAMDDLRMYDRRLSRAEAALLAATSDEPAFTEGDRLEAYLLHEDAPYRDLMALLRASREAEEARVSDMLEVMVMEEMDEPRQTHVLDRGLYDQPAESVKPAVPVRVRSLAGQPPCQPPGPGSVVLQQRAPADGQGCRQSVLADAVWTGYCGNVRGLRKPGHAAQPSGAAGLAGKHIRGIRLGHQGAAQDYRDVGHLPAIQCGHESG